MATAVKRCRICGKEYEACHSMNRAANVFRWQEVACSPECGAEYLCRVTESRNPAPPKPKWRRKATFDQPIVNDATAEQISSMGSTIESPVEDE